MVSRQISICTIQTIYIRIAQVMKHHSENNPEIVERFLRATFRGWQSAIENADEAALLTLKYDQTLSPSHLQFVFNASLPLIHTGENYIGWMEYSVFNNA